MVCFLWECLNQAACWLVPTTGFFTKRCFTLMDFLLVQWAVHMNVQVLHPSSLYSTIRLYAFLLHVNIVCSLKACSLWTWHWHSTQLVWKVKKYDNIVVTLGPVLLWHGFFEFLHGGIMLDLFPCTECGVVDPAESCTTLTSSQNMVLNTSCMNGTQFDRGWQHREPLMAKSRGKSHSQLRSPGKD